MRLLRKLRRGASDEKISSSYNDSCRNIFDGDAVRLSVRGVMGDLAIMAGHIPFVTALEDGEIKIYLSDIEIKKITCSGGVLTVSKDMVQVLASTASYSQDV